MWCGAGHGGMLRHVRFSKQEARAIGEWDGGRKTRREVADALGLKPETAKKYLQRARARARRVYGRAASPPAPAPPVRFRSLSLLPTDHV